MAWYIATGRTSPYAIAKVFAYWSAINYREAYDLYACNGILFNHESPRRGETFVTRKVTRSLANILSGKEKKLYLGNLSARRDWGFAPEYVECEWLILQQDRPDDFVIGTGVSHTVEEFVKEYQVKQVQPGPNSQRLLDQKSYCRDHRQGLPEPRFKQPLFGGWRHVSLLTGEERDLFPDGQRRPGGGNSLLGRWLPGAES